MPQNNNNKNRATFKRHLVGKKEIKSSLFSDNIFLYENLNILLELKMTVVSVPNQCKIKVYFFILTELSDVQVMKITVSQ